MRKTWCILCTFLFLLIGCGPGENATPTPFPTATAEVTPALVSNGPVAVAIADLATNPEAYEGARLQLTGQYQRSPRLVCGADPHPSPANWNLATGEAMVQASGFDEQLRTLLPDGLTVTVVGRWQHWRGPVGCGKQARPSDIWYLDVNRVVSPSPLARVTLTPTGMAEEAVIAQAVPTTTPTLAATEALPISSPSPVPATGSPTSTPTQPVIATPTAEIVASPTLSTTTPVTATATVTATIDPNATATATTDPDATATATPTRDPNATATPTATATATTNPNATATATSATLPTSTRGNLTVIDQGSIATDFEELVTEQLGGNEIHSWTFSIEASDAITVNVASESDLDTVVAILDSADTRIIERNDAGAGKVERIQGLELPEAGDYKIQIRSANGGAGYYSFMPLLSGAYNFVFLGNLNYGGSQTVPLPEENDHIWHFYGNANDNITITVTPNDDGDLFLELYGTSAELVSDFIDTGGIGEQEQLSEFILPDTGLYAIRIGEFDFQATGYQIRLVRN